MSPVLLTMSLRISSCLLFVIARLDFMVVAKSALEQGIAHVE